MGTPEAVRLTGQTNVRTPEVLLIGPAINSLREMPETSHRIDVKTEVHPSIAEKMRLRMESEVPHHILEIPSLSVVTLTTEPLFVTSVDSLVMRKDIALSLI